MKIWNNNVWHVQEVDVQDNEVNDVSMIYMQM